MNVPVEQEGLAISFENLGHAYRPDRWVFRHCSGKVRKGTVFSVLGPNGRGKSTLLQILLGSLMPTEGSVQVSSAAAFVPQFFQSNFDYNVLDIVLMGRARRVGLFAQPDKSDIEAAVEALARFGLEPEAHRSFAELSGGQRQLVIFARALASLSPILILDEPTASLDLKNQSLVLQWISRLAHEDGLTVVLSTHHPEHALAVSDESLIMISESEFLTGASKDLLSPDCLTQLYELPIRRVLIDYCGHSIESLVPIFHTDGRPGARVTGTPAWAVE